MNQNQVWDDIKDFVFSGLVILIGGALIYFGWTRVISPKEFQYQMTGVVTQTILEKPEFVVRIWHQYPSKVRSGKLSVYVNSSRLAARQKKSTKYFSFESWPPNEANATELRFDLADFDDDKVISVEVRFEAPGYKQLRNKSVFRNGRWQ